MIKLIVTDMDGTFLNNNNQVDDKFWDVFEKLKEKNIIFSSASGRQYYSLTEKLSRIKDDVLFIAENGSYVVYQGKELYSMPLDKKCVDRLIKIGRNIDGVDLLVCGKKSAYIEKGNGQLANIIGEYYDKYEVVSDLTEIEDEILKVTLHNPKGSEEHIKPYFKEEERKYKVSISGDVWLDIINKKANKGIAVNYIQKLWNIKPEETMAFGDFLNDIEMLEDAHYSYAMKDAHTELKSIAKEIIGSNNDGAVIKKIVEIAL